ncbi:uncharacterized protein PAC_16988 [Phialocephala subalpina]|uniref:Uncharacterized protein n=1 Tax=Phialocephala subalpina TaxID=576137 RepID=A0A1L7XPY5_9HELO|nr:uncharacterized protein PAC_16988 [Phialocephala subalpina]
MDIIIEATNEYQVGFLVAFITAQSQGLAIETWSEKSSRMTSLCAEAKHRYEALLLAKVRQVVDLASSSFAQSQLQEGQQRVLNDAKRRFDEVINSAKVELEEGEWKKGMFVSHEDLEQKEIIEEISNLSDAIRARQESAVKADRNARGAGSSAWREMYQMHAAEDRAEIEKLRGRVARHDATLKRMRLEAKHKRINEETTRILKLRDTIKGLELDAAQADANARYQHTGRWVKYYVKQAANARADIKKLQKQIIEHEVARCKLLQRDDTQSNVQPQNVLPGSSPIARLRAKFQHPSDWTHEELMSEYLSPKKQLEQQEEERHINLAEIESLRHLASREVEPRQSQLESEAATMQRKLEDRKLVTAEVAKLRMQAEQLAQENGVLVNQCAAAKLQLEEHTKREEERKVQEAETERQRAATEAESEQKQKVLEDRMADMKLDWEDHVRRQEEECTQKGAETAETRALATKQQVEQRNEARELREQLSTSQQQANEHAKDIETGNFMLKETNKLLDAVKAELDQKKEELREQKQETKTLLDTFLQREDELEAEFDRLDDQKRELLARESAVEELQSQLSAAHDSHVMAHLQGQLYTAQVQAQDRVYILEEELKVGEHGIQQLQAQLALAQHQAHDRIRTLLEELRFKEVEIQEFRASAERKKELAHEDTKRQIEQDESRDGGDEGELAELETDGGKEKIWRDEGGSGSEDGEWEQVEKEVEGVRKDVQSK